MTVESRGVSANTVRLAFAPVRALFATALEEGAIQRNPCSGIRLSNAVPGDMRAKALTEGELAALIAAVPKQWRLLIELLAETGLRIGEALALEWDDIDLGQQRLHVQRRLYRGSLGPPKSRCGRRTIPLTSRAAQALWRRQAAAEGPLVFPSRTGGLPPAGEPVAVVVEGSGHGGRGLGWLPHAATHVRDAALPRRLERAAGTADARPPLARIHARDLCAHDGGRAARARLRGAGTSSAGARDRRKRSRSPPSSRLSGSSQRPAAPS